jgi:hypothetical protein
VLEDELHIAQGWPVVAHGVKDRRPRRTKCDPAPWVPQPA